MVRAAPDNTHLGTLRIVLGRHLPKFNTINARSRLIEE